MAETSIRAGSRYCLHSVGARRPDSGEHRNRVADPAFSFARRTGLLLHFASLVSLQAVFELGFSFVILQMAAHECARLALHADGRVEGDAVAHARLASILQKTFRWYLVAAHG